MLLKTQTLRFPLMLSLTIACTYIDAADWLTMPGYFTHDSNTGLRTTQHTQKTPAVSRFASNYRESGYRQYRSTLQYGQAADNYHKVEKWGDPVRPYGEWRFPARPYSAPYSDWGAPFAGFNQGGYFPGWPNGYPVAPGAGGAATGAGVVPGFGANSLYGPGGASLTPYPHIPSSPYPVPPYYDGYHPNYGERPRLDDTDFYSKPTQ